MTCIVGKVTKNGCVLLGGDSAGVAGLSITVRKDPKVFNNGDFIFGFTSSFRMGDVLRYSFTPPDHDPRLDTDRYMRTRWVDALRRAFDAAGILTKQNNEEYGGTFLVGYQGRLFEINGDFQVGEAIANFSAVGCGEDIAKGAMYAMKDSTLSDEDQILLALEAAEEFSGGVRAPFNLVKLCPEGADKPKKTAKKSKPKAKKAS